MAQKCVVKPDQQSSIRVSYELEQAGDAFMTYGADATARLGDDVELGAFAARDENPLEKSTLFGGNVLARLGAGTYATGEIARTDDGLTSLTGDAWRLELRHQSSMFEGRVYGMQSDTSFNNPSSTFASGRKEYGTRWSTTLSSQSRVVAEAMRTEDTRTGGVRNGALLTFEQRLSDGLLGEVGYRWADETAAQVSAIGTDSLGHSVYAPSRVAPISTNSLRARLTAQVPDSKRSSVFAEYEQALDVSGAHRVMAGGEYRLFDRARLYGRHEWISSLSGPYAIGEAASQQNTVVGIDADYMRNGQMFSEYRARDAFAGRDAEASIGLRNRWALSQGLLANATFERISPLSGSASGQTVAATAGLDWTSSALWKASSRLEWRTSPGGDNLLGSAGYARKLTRDWTLLTRTLWSENTADQVQGRTQIGLAWRQTDQNMVNALLRLENRYDALDSLSGVRNSSMANIAMLLLNVQPNKDLVLTGRYAGKLTADSHNGSTTHATAQLFMGRAVLDLNERFDAGFISTVLGDAKLNQRQYGVGAELGYILMQNLRISGGYNFFGFYDVDFASLGYTQRGPYMEFGFKFDESLFSGSQAKGKP